MKTLFALPLVALCLLVSGCSTLTLAPVHYQWPVESVLTVDAKGMVEEPRYNLEFNVKPLLFAETADSVHVADISIRMIRDMDGYYYVVAPKFKNVYVFASDEGRLKMVQKILISEAGLASPAFNQRPPHIQLLNGKDKAVLLSKYGIQQGGQK